MSVFDKIVYTFSFFCITKCLVIFSKIFTVLLLCTIES